MTLFGLQLPFNGCWSMIFFGLRRPGLAFVGILLLCIFAAATLAAKFALDTAAAYLLLPYLCWVGFAASLTYKIWRLNRGMA